MVSDFVLLRLVDCAVAKAQERAEVATGELLSPHIVREGYCAVAAFEQACAARSWNAAAAERFELISRRYLSGATREPRAVE